MGATDEEWSVIEPKLVKVMETQRATRGGGQGMRAMFRGGRGGEGGEGRERRGGREGREPETATAKAATELGETLQNESAAPEEVKQKLQAYRDAKSAAEKELEAAQKDLSGVLTQRQEAMLVMVGMLD